MPFFTSRLLDPILQALEMSGFLRHAPPVSVVSSECCDTQVLPGAAREMDLEASPHLLRERKIRAFGSKIPKNPMGAAIGHLMAFDLP